MEFANRKNDGLLSFDEFTELLRPPEIVSQTALGDAAATLEAEAAAADELRLASAAAADGSGRMDIDGDSDSGSESGSGSGSVSGFAPSLCPALRRGVSSTRLTLSPAYARLYEEEESARRRKASALEAAAAMALADKAARDLEQRLLAEEQARDWRLLQELRRAEAAEDRWSCASCTYKNEPSAFFCVVCETRRPEADEEKRAAPRLDRVSADEGADADAAGPAFWQCATCSYNNDAKSDACEMCSAKKPKGQARQKKTVTLWACPLCTRLVTSDRNECDVCTGDREAVRAPQPEADAQTDAAGGGVAVLLGDSLIGRGGASLSAASLSGKVVALYFSAHWCGPCRSLTPQLSSIFSGAVAAGLPFEIVFVSGDSDAAAFDQYWATMPWPAVRFADDERRRSLNAAFGVRAIPAIVVLDRTGRLVTADGRADVARLGDAAVPFWIAKADGAGGHAGSGGSSGSGGSGSGSGAAGAAP